MRHHIISDEIFGDRNHAISYLARVLDNALRAAADIGSADAERVHLWRVDASADDLTDRRAEFGGSSQQMSEKAITCLEEAGEHHVGVVMIAGDRRFSVKTTPDGYRITISPLASQALLPHPVKSTPVETGAAQPSPSSPRPPGLSSGVPADALGKKDTTGGHTN